MQRSKRFRDRLGANGPGLTVAVIALVFALVGGAFAASGGLSGKQKKQVTKIAKKFAGKPGKTGATGPAGPQGSPGAKGDKGDKGDTGAQGKEGKEGKDGTSVVASTEPTGTPHCEERGGSKFVAGATTTYACNGKEGSPWTAGGVLPPGAMETGSWLVSGTKTEAEGLGGSLFTNISFPIPLSTYIEADHVVFVESVPAPQGCNPETGFATAEAPFAEPGYLCVFATAEGPIHVEFKAIEYMSSLRSAHESGADTTGARLNFKYLPVVGEEVVGHQDGTFAVTAPTAP